MKYNLLLPLLCIYCFAAAQSTCNYKINVDTQEEIFQLTQETDCETDSQSLPQKAV